MPTHPSPASKGLPGSATIKSRVKLDPALKEALSSKLPDEHLVVMVKLDSGAATFGKYAVSNRKGSAREKAFRDDVFQAIGADDGSDTSDRPQILEAAANVGVATVQAPRKLVERLSRSSAVTGLKLQGS